MAPRLVWETDCCFVRLRRRVQVQCPSGSHITERKQQNFFFIFFLIVGASNSSSVLVNTRQTRRETKDK